MAVPTVATYSVAAIEAANTALLGEIDAGTSNGYIAIRDSADVLLSTIDLNDPGGTVSGVDGSLTLDISGPDTNAAATGTAAYGEICDSDDTVILSIPVQQGTVAVSGYLVMTTVAIVQTETVVISSAVIS